VVSEPTHPSEGPLTINEGDDSRPCTGESSSYLYIKLTKPHVEYREPDVDRPPFVIDHKYCLANRLPLTEMENSAHSDSTDDGYMTSDNSRVDYTPQLSLPDIDNDTQHPRTLFYHKSTRYGSGLNFLQIGLCTASAVVMCV
jgi:hypothetical protein